MTVFEISADDIDRLIDAKRCEACVHSPKSAEDHPCHNCYDDTDFGEDLFEAEPDRTKIGLRMLRVLASRKGKKSK